MKASERAIIFAVSIGSFLEWYSVYHYIYWFPLISKNFFDLSSPLPDFIVFSLITILSLFSRPLGGLLFGFFGDRRGRKKSFVLSIVLLSIPSFLTALAPSFSSWSLFFIIYIGIMKFLQGIPAGGELPGAFCFLAETASPETRRYICSYAMVGPQLGQIVSMTQCFLLEKYCSPEFLVQYGWRFSFFIGGIIGILGFYFRRRMLESPLFQRLQEKHEVLNNPIKYSLKNYKRKIFLGFLISVFEVVGFFLIAFFMVENVNKIFHLNLNRSLVMNIIIFTPIVFIMPLIGKMGDKYKNKLLYILSAVGAMFFSISFYLSMKFSYESCAQVSFVLLVFSLCFPFALLPSLMAELYPTKVRYTCIGFSFNFCDSIIGGLTPLLTYVLMQKVGGPASFAIVLSLSAVVFLLTIPFIKLNDQKKLDIF